MKKIREKGLRKVRECMEGIRGYERENLGDFKKRKRRPDERKK